MDIKEIKTEENDNIRKDSQHKISINDSEIWADSNMIELLKALNNAGLITRSHCGGHGTGKKWVIIKDSNITDIKIRNDAPYNEIVLSWDTDKDIG
jgi:Na+-transporting NADH:ubiquinone oxidoreductase subunit NqrF